MERRSFLKTAGASLASLPLVAARPALASLAPRTKNAPRYVVRIHTMGGIDPVVTADPKRPAEVESWVDVPFAAKDIVEAGRIPVGPLFAQMKGWKRPLTLLKGVAVGSANHETGLLFANAFRTRVTQKTPTIFDVLGSYRDGQPLGSVSIGGGLVAQYSPTGNWFGTGYSWFGPFGKDLFDHLDAADPEDLLRMARVLRKQAKSVSGVSPSSDLTASSMNDTAALFERMPKVPKFKLEAWPAPDGPPYQNTVLQRTLWAIENDLTSTVFANVGGRGDWDSHFDCTASQPEVTLPFVALLDKFLTELETRKNEHGTLADNTLVVVASELGRFPRMNEMLGKDHFPETFYLFSGRWFAGAGVKGFASFGETDRRMAALPVDLATGRPKSGGHVVTLDDVGSTILQIAGIDPEPYGYTGTPLPFLLRT